jgi:hypothetical protein
VARAYPAASSTSDDDEAPALPAVAEGNLRLPVSRWTSARATGGAPSCGEIRSYVQVIGFGSWYAAVEIAQRVPVARQGRGDAPTSANAVKSAVVVKSRGTTIRTAP